MLSEIRSVELCYGSYVYRAVFYVSRAHYIALRERCGTRLLWGRKTQVTHRRSPVCITPRVELHLQFTKLT